MKKIVYIVFFLINAYAAFATRDIDAAMMSIIDMSFAIALNMIIDKKIS